MAEAVLAVEAAVLQLVRFGRPSLHFAQCALCPHWGRTYGLRTSGPQTHPHVTLPNAAYLPVQSAAATVGTEPLSPLLPHQAGVGSAASFARPSLLHAECSSRSDQEADPFQDHAVVMASYSLWRKKSVLKPVNIQSFLLYKLFGKC